MSEFIPDQDAATLIQQVGIESSEVSEDGFTVTTKLNNGETLIQHRGPRQYEYSGSLDASMEPVPEQPVAPAPAEQPPLDPAAPPAA